MRLGANGYRARRILVAQWLERIEEKLPAALPEFHQFSANLGRLFEFSVAVAVGLFAVGGEKIFPARTHVAGHVFHDDGDAIGLFVKRGEKSFVGTLRKRALDEFLVIAKQLGGVFYI